MKCHMGFIYMCIPNIYCIANIYCSIYYNVHYLYLLVVISQDEIMLAAAVRGLVDIVKECLKKNVKVNAKEQDFVSYILL